jgi:hypothetical protein
MKSVKKVVDKVAETISKNKVIAAAVVSLFAVTGLVSAEDAGTWTNIVSAVATVVSAAL